MSQELTLFLAQLPEAVYTGLAQAGVLGCVVAALFWRDSKRDERDAKRDEKLDRLADAINALTRSISLEVLSRPHVIDRARSEAADLLEASQRHRE